MSEEINEIFEQWKQFLSWCYENNDKTTEIHRDSLERVMAYTRQLENIIKEAREYIKDKWEMELKDSMEDFLDHDELIDRKRLLHILEILDKEGK